jgi:hypothetical protein
MSPSLAIFYVKKGLLIAWLDGGAETTPPSFPQMISGAENKSTGKGGVAPPVRVKRA